MALTDQPYFPFYVDDYLTDEKLLMCDPASEGIYNRIMCHLHKSDSYGKIIITPFEKTKLEQKLNKTEPNYSIDSLNVDKTVFLMYVEKVKSLTGRDYNVVFDALFDLIGNDVLKISDGVLWQKRMVKDGDLSMKRSRAGKQNGNKIKSKVKQIPVIGNENVIEDKNEIDNNKLKPRKKFQKPTVDEIKKYCQERNNNIDPQKFFDFYESKGWMIGKNKMKSWKACVRTWENNNNNSNPTDSSDDNR